MFDTTWWIIPCHLFDNCLLYADFGCFTKEGGWCVGFSLNPPRFIEWYMKEGKKNGYCKEYSLERQ